MAYYNFPVLNSENRCSSSCTAVMCMMDHWHRSMVISFFFQWHNMIMVIVVLSSAYMAYALLNAWTIIHDRLERSFWEITVVVIVSWSGMVFRVYPAHILPFSPWVDCWCMQFMSWFLFKVSFISIWSCLGYYVFWVKPCTHNSKGPLRDEAYNQYQESACEWITIDPVTPSPNVHQNCSEFREAADQATKDNCMIKWTGEMQKDAYMFEFMQVYRTTLERPPINSFMVLSCFFHCVSAPVLPQSARQWLSSIKCNAFT